MIFDVLARLSVSMIASAEGVHATGFLSTIKMSILLLFERKKYDGVSGV